MLPLSVQVRIQSLLETMPPQEVMAARRQLTQRYRDPFKKAQGFLCAQEGLAYVATRLPATFSAMEAALSHVPLTEVKSILDLGAGPGTAALAAALHWKEATRFHLVEGDAFMSGLSRQLLQDIPEIAHQNFSFSQENLLSFQIDESYDFVVLSYVLNELSAIDQAKVIKLAWARAAKGLIILMPGTPAGYGQLMLIRDLLVETGAFIAAPCPHHNACPLSTGDWCHFSTRLMRSSFHREIKGASLPYEDEKFSYLVALREPVSHSIARVIRKPLQRSGHVTLNLCTDEGAKRQTISRRDKELYKKAVKLNWGDSLDF